MGFEGGEDDARVAVDVRTDGAHGDTSVGDAEGVDVGAGEGWGLKTLGVGDTAEG